MNTPAGAEGSGRPDVRGAARRVHVAVHATTALAVLAAVSLPIGPRLAMAAVALVALLVSRIGTPLPWLSRTELIAGVDVVAGFAAFLILPEVPALGLGLALVGLVTAAVVCRPTVERAVAVTALGFEIAKLPIVATSDFVSSVPFIGEVLPHPADVMAGSILQSVALFAVYGIAHVAAGVLRRTQRALVASEARYRILTEALPNAALVVADGRVAFANAAAQTMLGDVATSVQGHYLEEVLSEDTMPGLKAAMAEVRNDGVPREVDGRPIGDAAHAVHLSASLSPLEFEGRSAVMIVLNDISSRYAAEQARREGEARFRAAFLNTATPFVLLNPDATILDLNDAAQRLLGLSRDDAVGVRWERFVEHGNIDEFREFVGAATVGMLDHLDTEIVLIPQSGSAVRAEIDVSVDRTADGGLRNLIVQIHDVTARHAAEHGLRVSEERYRSLFERSPVALYRTRPNGDIVDVNESLLALMGYSRKSDLMAMSAHEVYVHPSERDRITELLERDGEMVGFEYELLRSDGSRIWVQDTARRVVQGDECFYEGSLVDVTARRRADALLRRAAVQGETVAKLGQFALTTAAVDELFAETVHSISSVLDVSTAGVVLPAAGGFEPVASVGWPAGHDRLEQDRVGALIDYAAGANRPVVVTPPAGNGADHSAVAVAIRGAERLLGVLVAMDRAGRPFSPDGLHYLRSVANVLAAAIDRHESRSQLEQLVRSKDEFIASISHELRTPLTVVAGMAHELQDGWRGFPDSEIEELLALVVDQSADMRNLIEDLLVAARADIGKVAVYPAPVDVVAAVEAVLGALPDRDGVVICTDLEPGTALADSTRVRQIVRNLLTNAVRYGGSSITISTGTESGHVYIRVHDDGPGIPLDQHEQIFEPYESVHESVGTPGSVGLGLTISRKLARLMGGDLLYRLANGSLFELELPQVVLDVPVRPDEEVETPLSWSSLLN